MKRLSNFEKLSLLKKNLSLLKGKNNDQTVNDLLKSYDLAEKNTKHTKLTKTNMPKIYQNHSSQKNSSADKTNQSKVISKEYEDPLDQNVSEFLDQQTNNQSIEKSKDLPNDTDLLKKYEHLKELFDKLNEDMPFNCDEYCEEGDPFTTDKEVNTTLFEAGINKSQAKIVFSLARQILFDISSALASEYAKAFEEAKSINYFQGRDNYQIVKEKIKNWAVANIGQQAFEKLNESHDGRLAIYKLLQQRNSLGLGLGDSDNNSDLNVAKLREIMKKPSYWLKKDPVAIKKVQTGFAKLYSKSD